MKKIKNRFFVVCTLILFLSGCKTAKTIIDTNTNISSNTVEKDSVFTHDSLITVSQSIAKAIIPILGDSSKPKEEVNVPETIVVEGRAHLKLKVIHDTIFAEANCDSILLLVKKQYEAHYKTVLTSNDTTKINVINTETIIYKTRKIVSILAWLGGLTLVFIGYKIYRKVTPRPFI